MGRVKEAYADRSETEQRIAHERAEAAYFAVPDAMQEGLEIGRALKEGHRDFRIENAELRAQLGQLQGDFGLQNSPLAKWKERGIGFLLGCGASVIASVIWWQLGKAWPLFR